VKQEAQKLYVGKYQPLLTGPDKIPDYLRTYFEGVRRQTEDFRIGCCRQLREFVNKDKLIINN
jgi:hypothetical protein